MNTDRNFYREDVNFPELASQDLDFAKVLKPNGQLDFSDPTSVQQLTKSLLKRDFNLSLTLPPNRLCPPVPNRFNYILWIQSLLDTSSSSYSDRYEPEREVVVLDIGTGASCIYPLLGCAQRPRWKFVATDIDDLSLEYARENVRRNGLDERIKVAKTTADGPMISLDVLGLESIDLLLTNPPFHPSTASLLASAALKSRPPNTACTGSTNEMVTPGGEVAFALRILEESFIYRHRVQWYTTMLGKLSSVPLVLFKIRSLGITNWAVAEFVQGSKTRRWALGWSYIDRRPKGEGVARAVGGSGSISKALLPFPAEYEIRIGVGRQGEMSKEAEDRINAILKDLPDIYWMWRPNIKTGVGFATGNIWSRRARRKQNQTSHPNGGGPAEGAPDVVEEDYEEEKAFAFKISVGEVSLQAGRKKEIKADETEEMKAVAISIRWIKGYDSALFESFCGMMKRKLEEA